MAAGLIQDPIIDAMGSYMTRLSKRQQIVASNLANIDTPGYRTKEISFHATMEELLANEAFPLKVSRPGHNSLAHLASRPLDVEVFEAMGLPMRENSNNVDLDHEMLKLGQTTFGYSMIVQLLRSKFRTISSSINEGRSG